MIRSTRARLTGLLTVLGGLVLLAACDDPSAVGLSIIDAGETDPSSVIIPASEARLDTLTRLSGLVRLGGVLPTRTLAGRVEDPAYGTLTASGHFDFRRPDFVPPDFPESGLLGAVLRLEPVYLYGDTTAVTTLDVFEITQEWDAHELTTNDDLPVGTRLLGTVEVAASDTLVDVRLDRAWVIEREMILRSAEFDTHFHGLQLRPRDSNRLIVGFSERSSLLVEWGQDVEGGADTLSFMTQQLFTSTHREPGAASPPGHILPLQSGLSEALYLSFDLEGLRPAALSAAFIRLDADTLAVQQAGPTHFQRPLANTLALYGISPGAAPVLLAEASLDRTRQAYIFSATFLRSVLQDAILGRPRFDHLVVRPAELPMSFNVAPIIDVPERRPRVVLVVVEA